MSDRSFYDAKKDYGLLGVAPPAPPILPEPIPAPVPVVAKPVAKPKIPATQVPTERKHIFSLSDMPKREDKLIETRSGHGFEITIVQDGLTYRAEVNFAADETHKRRIKLVSDNLGRIRSEIYTYAAQNLTADDMHADKSLGDSSDFTQESDIRNLLNRL